MKSLGLNILLFAFVSLLAPEIFANNSVFQSTSVQKFVPSIALFKNLVPKTSEDNTGPVDISHTYKSLDESTDEYPLLQHLKKQFDQERYELLEQSDQNRNYLNIQERSELLRLRYLNKKLEDLTSSKGESALLDKFTQVELPGIRMLPTDSLFEAIKTGDYDRVAELIDTDIDVNQADENGLTSLHWAAFLDHVEIIMPLLKAGANMNQRSNRGNTPLLLAIEKGHVWIILLLLKAGADVNQTHNNGDIPLHFAIFWGRVDIILPLLNAGAKVNQPSNHGNTPLHLAVFFHCVDIILPLLNAGADVNKADKNGNTPLYYALLLNKKEFVELLRARGASRKPSTTSKPATGEPCVQ